MMQNMMTPQRRKRKCPKCTFDNDPQAKKCEMCHHMFGIQIRFSNLLKDSMKFVRNPRDLEILHILDRLFVESSQRCNMRGPTPNRVHWHLPSEFHIKAMPSHISLQPQLVTCDVTLTHTNVELSSKINASVAEITRLIPKAVKIVVHVPKLPPFRLLHTVARPGALRDPEVLALGLPTLKGIDNILVNASKHCSIRGGGRKQTFSFPTKLHPPNGVCVEFMQGSTNSTTTNSSSMQQLRLRVRHTHNTMLARINVNFNRFKRIFRDHFLHIHDEEWHKSKSAAPKHIIEKIKSESYVMKAEEEEEEEEKHPEGDCDHDMCCVCHENMVSGNRIANIGCPNNHKFHLECILPWLERKSVCPLCRHDFRKEGK